MRSGLFAIGAIMLIIGIMIVANDQPKVSAIESMFGGVGNGESRIPKYGSRTHDGVCASIDWNYNYRRCCNSK